MNTMKETLARLRDRIRETQESIKELDMVLMLDGVYLSDKEEIRILDKIDNLQDKLKEYIIKRNDKITFANCDYLFYEIN